jgi:choline-sulfatase
MTTKLEKPNIMLIMTDQQREIRDFPPQWVEKNLKSLTRLQKNGMTYHHNYINTAPCWASRGVLMSGTYPLLSQVLEVGNTLPPSFINFSKVLKKAGYRTVYKGKWHLTGKFDTFSTEWACYTDEGARTTVIEEDKYMESLYGFSGWTSPDAGTAEVISSKLKSDIATLGGGNGKNDLRVITGKGFIAPDKQESVLDFLKNNAQTDEPYCLVVSLVNPHDISVYPGKLESYGYSMTDFANYDGFQLPESFYKDDLSTKPDAQLNYLNGFDHGKMDEETALNYLKFYAYLQTLSDQLIENVLDAMTPEQLNNTVIIRTADHGEMGAAHGGLREKFNTFYQETINVPLIISNPVLFPQAQTCNELVGQVDLIPTIAEIVGLDAQEVKEEFLLCGNSFAQTLTNPQAHANDAIMFLFYSGANCPVKPSGAASVICALVNKKWKYGVYFAPEGGLPSGESYPYPDIQMSEEKKPFSITTSNWYPVVILDSVQYELYDLENDPNELTNLLYGANIPANIQAIQKKLHHQLTQKMTKNNSMPIGWRDIVI